MFTSFVHKCLSHFKKNFPVNMIKIRCMTFSKELVSYFLKVISLRRWKDSTIYLAFGKSSTLNKMFLNLCIGVLPSFNLENCFPFI